MKRIPSWSYYTVLRLLVFAIPLAVLLILGIVWWASVIGAALIGLCLSYIFLSRPRNAVSSDLYELRHREKPLPSEDDEVEDAFVDSAEAARADAALDAAPAETPDDASADRHGAGSKPPAA